jgi:hypothetical protein
VRGVDGAALDREEVGVDECRPDDGDDLVAQPGPDDDGNVSVGGDAAVAEQLDERFDGAAADLDRERAGDLAG